MSNITWERRGEAFKAIHDAVSETSLSVFDPVQRFGEVGKLVKYRGKLYAFVMPHGLIYAFDGKDWEIAYNVKEKQGYRESDGLVMTAWGAHHWTKDDRLYFFGVFWKTGGLAYVRFDGVNWEFYDLNATLGEGEFTRGTEFGDYLYIGSAYLAGVGERIFRSSDGVNWSISLAQNEGFGIEDLATVGNPANVVFAAKSNGKILKSTDGTTWSLDYATEDAKSVERLCTVSNGDGAIAGGAEGGLHLWDGAYQTWRKIGNADKNMTISGIKNFGFDAGAFVTCQQNVGDRARSGKGGLFYVSRDARIFRLLTTFGYSIFGVEDYGGDLFFGFGWTDVLATTQFKTQFCGVKKLSMVELAKLLKLLPEPFSETVTLSNIQGDTYDTTNVGAYSRKRFKITNTGDNTLFYNWFYTVDGQNWWLHEPSKALGTGVSITCDFSEKNYSALRFKCWINVGLPTNVRIEKMLDNVSTDAGSILSAISAAPTGERVTKIGVWEDANGNVKYLKFYNGTTELFTLEFSNAGASDAETWNIIRS